MFEDLLGAVAGFSPGQWSQGTTFDVSEACSSLDVFLGFPGCFAMLLDFGRLDSIGSLLHMYTLCLGVGLWRPEP